MVSNHQISDIGVFPSDWKISRIADIGNIITGSTPKTSDKENYGEKFLFVSPIDMGKNKYITKTNKMLSKNGFEKTRKLASGAIMVTCIGSTIGKIGLASKELCTNQQINSIVCNKDVVNEFLYYAIDYNFKYYKKFISNQAVPIINKSLFSSFSIQLPLVSEQNKIAAILTSVDNAIEKTESIIKQTEKVKKGLMQQLLTKGIGHTKFKKTEIGEIPEEWEVKVLEDICEKIFVGIATSTTNSYTTNGIPIIRNQNIHEDYLDTTHLLQITEDFSEKNKNKKLLKGDVLTVRTGYPGITCVVPRELEGAHTFTTLVSRPVSKYINSYYLSRYINSDVGKKFVMGGKAGGAQQNLNVGVMKKLIVAVPPIEVQCKIVDIINSIDAKITNENGKHIQLISSKRAIMQVLLTGKVRVNVDEMEVTR